MLNVCVAKKKNTFDVACSIPVMPIKAKKKKADDRLGVHHIEIPSAILHPLLAKHMPERSEPVETL